MGCARGGDELAGGGGPCELLGPPRASRHPSNAGSAPPHRIQPPVPRRRRRHCAPQFGPQVVPPSFAVGSPQKLRITAQGPDSRRAERHATDWQGPAWALAGGVECQRVHPCWQMGGREDGREGWQLACSRLTSRASPAARPPLGRAAAAARRLLAATAIPLGHGAAPCTAAAGFLWGIRAAAGGPRHAIAAGGRGCLVGWKRCWAGAQGDQLQSRAGDVGRGCRRPAVPSGPPGGRSCSSKCQSCSNRKPAAAILARPAPFVCLASQVPAAPPSHQVARPRPPGPSSSPAAAKPSHAAC